MCQKPNARAESVPSITCQTRGCIDNLEKGQSTDEERRFDTLTPRGEGAVIKEARGIGRPANQELVSQALALLSKIPRSRWSPVWHELAAVTYGITDDDPRLAPVRQWLDACDKAFLENDWAAFQSASEKVKQAVGGQLF